MKPITRAAVAAALVCGACSHHGEPAQPGEGSGRGSASGVAIVAKKISLSWGIAQSATSADVFLQTTDETGAQVPHALGTFPGQCAKITPAADMNALTAVACTSGTSGTELHALVQSQQIVVLRMATQQGNKPDPMAREELTRFPAPPGAAIVVAP